MKLPQFFSDEKTHLQHFRCPFLILPLPFCIYISYLSSFPCFSPLLFNVSCCALPLLPASTFASLLEDFFMRKYLRQTQRFQTMFNVCFCLLGSARPVVKAFNSAGLRVLTHSNSHKRPLTWLVIIFFVNKLVFPQNKHILCPLGHIKGSLR